MADGVGACNNARYTYADGKPITCDACLVLKNHPDYAFPSQPMWWEYHGQLDRPSAHNKMDNYCTVIWKKKQFTMSREQFCAWAKSEDGKVLLADWTRKIVEQRRERGANCRISQKMMDSWANAGEAVVKRQSQDSTDIIEPEDVWVPESQYLDETGRRPSEDNIMCEWLELRSGLRDWGFWKKSDAPIRRVKKRRTAMIMDEVVDDNSLELTADQLTQRYQQEASSMDSGSQAISAGDLAAIQSRHSQPAEIQKSEEATNMKQRIR